MLRTLSCCAVLAATLLVTAAAAQAAPPTVAMAGVAATSPTTASFIAEVNPGGLATTAHFEYGTTPDLGQKTPDVALGAGTLDVPLEAKVEGLDPGARYYMAVYVANADDAGYAEGPELVMPRTPALQELPVSDLRPVAATLHVKVATRGVPVTLTATLSRPMGRRPGAAPAPASIPAEPVTVTADGDVALPVAGLEPESLYSWVVSAKSEGGTALVSGSFGTPRLIGVTQPQPSVRVAPYGSQVTFSGAVPTAAGLPMALHQQSFPYLTPFAAIPGASGAAGPGGAFTFTVPALVRARYSVAVGSPDYVAPVAATATEGRVAAAVRARVARARGHRFVVSGSYAPDVPARVVLLRRGHGRSGVAVAGRQAGGKRTFRFPARALKPGAYEVRVAVGPGVEVEDAKSASFRVPRR